MPDLFDEPAATDVRGVDPGIALNLRNRLLTGGVGSAMMWLAVPVLAEQFLQLLILLVDTYLAGTINKEATTAIGLATTVVWLANLLFSFVGTGATALVSRHAGMGEPERANHFSNQAISLAVMMGIAECALIYTAAPLLPRFLHWEPEPTRIVVQFLRIDCWAYLIYSLTLIGAACWRGMGDTRTPLYVMGVVNVWNMVASTCLRFGAGPLPELGVVGIPLGTLSARLLGGFIVLALLWRGRSGLRLVAADLRCQWASTVRLLRVGIPAGIDGLLMWTCHVLFIRIISSLGTGDDQSAFLAAHFIGVRVEALSYLPAVAWGTAAATMVGQSLGAGRPDRAMRAGHLAALQGAGTCMVMGVFYFLFAPQIYWLFNSTDYARVAAIGVPALRVEAFFQIPLGLMIIYTFALRGAGDTRWPLLFTLVGMVGVRLPLAYLGGIVLHGGLIGAWLGMFGDMTTRAILSTWRFARGGWQKTHV